MTKLTKKNDNFQGSPKYYGDDIYPFEARDKIFEDPNPVAVANE